MIYFKETGYDKTIYNFFELVRETEKSYFFRRIAKSESNGYVLPNRTKFEGSEVRVNKNSKTMLNLQKWEGQDLKENHNYTYTGL
jgi:SOS-response transcriptional repressor LexA